jgi:hypothetical protein
MKPDNVGFTETLSCPLPSSRAFWAVIAKRQFGTASAFGFFMSAFAAGSLAGMVCAGLVRHRRRGRTLLVAGVVSGLCVAPVGFLTT